MNGRLLESFDPSPEDLALASQLPADACPRRYCWWWKSLSFDWDKSPAEGCTWLAAEKPSHWKFREIPCCRCESNSVIDHFETRGPQIELDQIDASHWLKFREENRRNYPG